MNTEFLLYNGGLIFIFKDFFMSKKTIEDKKKALEEKKKKLFEELKKVRKSARELAVKENTDNRKIDKRKKILIGAMVLFEIKENRIAQNWLTEKMDKFLSRTDERLLFGLEPIPEIVEQENERKAKREALKAKKKAEELSQNANLQGIENDLIQGNDE